MQTAVHKYLAIFDNDVGSLDVFENANFEVIRTPQHESPLAAAIANPLSSIRFGDQQDFVRLTDSVLFQNVILGQTKQMNQTCSYSGAIIFCTM